MTKIFSFAGLVVALLASTAHAEGNLNLLVYEGYADASFVDPFTKETGCTVTAKYVGSGDEILTTLLTGRGSDYDLTTISSDVVGRLIDADAIDPIDMNRIPNAVDFFDALKKPAYAVRGNDVYGLPYTFGIIRLIVDGDKMKEVPDSLGFLWSPELKHQVAIWDDLEAVYMTGRYLGFPDVYAMTDEQLAKVQEKLIEMKPNIVKYWFSAGELTTLYQQSELTASNSWESTMIDLFRENRNVVEIIPKEGRSGWIDTYTIVKGASKNECVYKWLDYVSSPEVQAKGFAVTGFTYANTKMPNYLDQKDQAILKRLGVDNPASLDQVDFWRPVANRGAYLEMWNKVKAASN